MKGLSLNSIITRFWWPIFFILVMWVGHLFQFMSGIDFGQFGILPRQIHGLKGILFSPLVHGDIEHLMSNTGPFIFLFSTLIFVYPKIAFRSFVMIYLLTGLAVWLFARGQVYHIGASGVVYGLVSQLFWLGVFRRNLKSIIIALLMLMLYSSFVVGIFPTQTGISWESHLLGAVVGMFAAYWYKEEIEQDEKPFVPSWQQEPPTTEQFLLPRDTFEKTKHQRWLEEQERLNQQL